MSDIEDRIGKAQERIANSVAALGEFLAGKTADAIENAAGLIENATKSVTGKDPTEAAKVRAAAAPKATASKTTAKPRTKGGEAVN